MQGLARRYCSTPRIVRVSKTSIQCANVESETAYLTRRWRRELTGTIFRLAGALFLYASAAAAHAQTNSVEREIKASPGRDVRVGIYTSIRADCTSGPLSAIRLLVAPAHGTVSVKRGALKATNFKQCLAVEVPAFVAFYRAAQDFNGADVFDLEISIAEGRKQIQHFRVSVSNNPNGGQGI
jgi:hypothetical protein